MDVTVPTVSEEAGNDLYVGGDSDGREENLEEGGGPKKGVCACV